MSRYFTPALAALEPYVPGEQPKMQNLIKLNTNENPYPPAPGVAAAVAGAAENLRLYSDLGCTALKSAIAEKYDVLPENILCGNGSDENLMLAIRAFCDGGRPLAFADVTYGFYPVWCDLFGIPKHVVPLADDFTLDPAAYCGLGMTAVIANPNAPTGRWLPPAALEPILQADPDHVLIVDEAYVDFCDEAFGNASCVPLTKKYDNLLVVQTFSKSRSMAGARLGFCVGNAALIADLDRVKFSLNPYNVNSLTQAAGAAAIADEAYFAQTTAAIRAARRWTADMLGDLGLAVLPSQANFVFAKTPKMGGADLYKALRARGILVRHFAAPRTKDWLRITIGTPEQMQALATALREILA